jgi:hypothetical protein
MNATFRDAVYRMSPPRLQTPRAARIVYSMVGLPLDEIIEACDQATKARFPELAPDDALPHIGRDRVIRRGPLEPSLSYRTRLLLWLEAWKGAGVGRALLDQIAGYLTPQKTRIRIWTQTGLIYTREASGVFSMTRVAAGVWDWDGLTSLWSRFWLIIDSIDGVPWSRDGTWNDGERWGDTSKGTWGSTATFDEVQSIRAIVDDWKPAASVCEHIIVSFDVDAFNLAFFSSFPTDGTWGHWGKYVGGVKRAARDSRAIYWRGVA